LSRRGASLAAVLPCELPSASLARVRATPGARRPVIARLPEVSDRDPVRLRHAHAVELARVDVVLNVIQCQLGNANPRHDLDLPAKDRPRRNPRHRPHARCADDVRHRRTPALINPSPDSGSAAHAPAGRSCLATPSRSNASATKVDHARRSRPDVVRCERLELGERDACLYTEAMARALGMLAHVRGV
jgi:hypothetical protein